MEIRFFKNAKEQNFSFCDKKVSDSKLDAIPGIVRICDHMPARSKIVVSGFGVNQDLTLTITKSECYWDYFEWNRLQLKDWPDDPTDYYNIVEITTVQNGIGVVDDSGDVHVDSLTNELLRIYDSKKFHVA